MDLSALKSFFVGSAKLGVGIALSILVVALFGWAIYQGNGIAQSQEPALAKGKVTEKAHAKKTDKTAKKDQRGTEKSPLVVKVLAPEVPKPDVSKEADKGEQKSFVERVIEIGSIVITALATVVMAFFTGRLWLSTDKLWGEAKAASDIASKSASAAQKSAEIAEHALIAGQRAFVSCTFRASGNIDLKTGSITHWTFTPIWANAGDTPTRGMVNHISIQWLDKELPLNWDFPDLWVSGTPAEERKAVPLGINPKGFIDGQSVSVPVAVIADVINGKTFLYLWGWTSYNDVFPNTARHVTRFAVRIVIGGDASALDTKRISFSFNFLRRYNCSDEECEHQGYPATWTPRQQDV